MSLLYELAYYASADPLGYAGLLILIPIGVITLSLIARRLPHRD